MRDSIRTQYSIPTLDTSGEQSENSHQPFSIVITVNMGQNITIHSEISSRAPKHVTVNFLTTNDAP